VALQTPSHVERLYFFHFDHLIDSSVTADATGHRRSRGRVVEVNVIRQLWILIQGMIHRSHRLSRTFCRRWL